MAEAALLVNGQAAAAADPDLVPRLRRILSAAGGADEDLAVTADEGEVPLAIRRFAERGARLICVYGGDGTILSTLTAVVQLHDAEALPRIGLLRGGTINTLAKYLKVNGQPEALLERLLAGGCASRRLGVIRANERYGLTFGAALMGRFYHEYNQLERISRLTVTGYVARVVLSALFDTERAQRLLRPAPGRVEADGEALPMEAYSVIVASCMEDHGFGARPTYRGSSEPGRFQLLASSKGRGAIVSGYHRLLLGRPFSGKDHFDGMVQEAQIVFDQPELCMLDGEVFAARQVSLNAGPELEFALPWRATAAR
jgi:diacylglycerol kinase family enzyme